jgi:UDP-3-O-[3-hydroxymyristoyl] glucosamine N-acyltransferase
LLYCNDPFSKFKQLIEENTAFIPAIHPISDTAKIGTNTLIMPGVFVGQNVTVGNNCIIHPNVSIYQDTVIGDNVIIHSNTTIGSDAFYVKRRPDHYEKFPSCGRVVIESDVEIGAGCTIDRGVTSDTVIGTGTKIDNQVHVGHDTVIGKHCIIAAQVGISGVVRIEDYVKIWGQVGIDRDLTIGKEAVIFAKSGVSKSLVGGKTYFGSPASESRESMKNHFLTRRLQEILDRLDNLENNQS